MNKDTLKIEEICAILKACSENGVTSIKLGDALHADFTKAQTPELTNPIVPLHDVVAQAEQQTKQASAKEEFTKKMETLDQMLIDDPEGFFEAVKRGDLTDEERA